MNVISEECAFLIFLLIPFLLLVLAWRVPLISSTIASPVLVAAPLSMLTDDIEILLHRLVDAPPIVGFLDLVHFLLDLGGRRFRFVFLVCVILLHGVILGGDVCLLHGVVEGLEAVVGLVVHYGRDVAAGLLDTFLLVHCALLSQVGVAIQFETYLYRDIILYNNY